MALFPDITEPSLSKSLERYGTATLTRLPVAQYEYVNVTFTAINSDVIIPYTRLKPNDVNTIRWQPVSLSAAGIIYRDLSGTAKAWTSQYIILRSNIALTARLLLFLES